MGKSHGLILLIEDSDEDFAAMQRVLRQIGWTHALQRCVNAEEALDFLRQRGQAENQPDDCLPSLILLDLNLPGTDGRELLLQIKGDKSFRTIPTVVLTTSSDPHDIEDCYRNGANSYQIKPLNYEKFGTAMRVLLNYWLETATLPAN